MRRSRLVSSLIQIISVALLLTISCASAAFSQPNPPAAAAPVLTPDVRVDFFGAEKGYSTGAADVVMLCVLRNVGRGPLPANSLRVRCYALVGFDYTDGELTPIVPPLEPHQAVTFRWRLQPTDPTTALVASVLLTRVDEKPASEPGVKAAIAAASSAQIDARKSEPVAYVPKAVIAVVPHIVGSTPDIVSFTAPSAVSGIGVSRIGNDRLSLTIAPVHGRDTVGLLAAKSPDGWDYVAVAFPMVQIRTSVDGQSPWWRDFRLTRSESLTDPGSASLNMYGLCGDDWEAQISLETHKDSGILTGRLRLKARKTCRLFGVQLPRLISANDRSHPIPASDGSSNLVLSDPAVDEADNLAAAHRGQVTSGMAWSSRAPITDWLAFPLPPGDADHTEQLGMQWVGGERGEVVLQGGIIDFNFRLFCVSPSDTARDAHRFVMP